MLLALLATLGHANCPDLAERVNAAWALFGDAELQDAKDAIADAYEGVPCQGRVVTTEELMALYRLDGLISLALGDPKGATYATIRAVASDHLTGAPPAEYGPELADMYTRWTSRLAEQLIYIRVAGEGLVWIDGREIDATQYLQVAEGEHLVQIRAGGTLRTHLIELTDDHVVMTGVEGPGPVPIPVETVPVPEPTEASIVPAPPAEVVRGRRHPAPYFIGGLVSGAVGGAAIYWAWQREQAFADATYDAEVYRGCIKGQACYEDARLQQIRGDADLINIGYGAGYGLCGLGTVLVGVGVVGVQPRPTSVAFSWRF